MRLAATSHFCSFTGEGVVLATGSEGDLLRKVANIGRATIINQITTRELPNRTRRTDPKRKLERRAPLRAPIRAGGARYISRRYWMFEVDPKIRTGG